MPSNIPTRTRSVHPAPLPAHQSSTHIPRWVRGKVAAPYLGTTEGTLAKWRHEGRGPAYHVPPGIRTVLYDLSELDVFIEAGRVETTGSAQ
jgi:hypothetical protein